jgi:tetratricopeptide (TPR) repeat protein
MGASKGRAAAFLILLAMLALTSSAVAQGSEKDQPWKVGVSEETRDKANALFREGNSLLKESRFKDAVKVYDEAISIWDHPAIHYNLALALMSLDSPIRAHEALENALRFEGRALESDKLNDARTHFKWTRQQLATVELSAAQEGTMLLLNGKEVGSTANFVRIGWNTVTARKDGYVEQTKNKMLGPGESWKFEADMYTSDDVTRYRRRWAKWKPWAVFGGGAALLAIGGTTHSLAASGFKEYDDSIRKCGGCVPSSSQQSTHDNASLEQTIAFAAYGIGGAALLTGAYLIYANRAQAFRIDIKEQAVPSTELSLAPTVSRDGLGLSARLNF